MESPSSPAAPFDWDAYEWSEEARGRKGSLLQGELSIEGWHTGQQGGLRARAREREGSPPLNHDL